MNRTLLAPIVFMLFAYSNANAEFPALESALRLKLDDFSSQLSGKSVLVSLDEPSELDKSWQLSAAIESEIVAQLLAHKIEAVDDDTDERFDWLARAKTKSIERWRKQSVYDVLVTGNYEVERDQLILVISALARDSDNPIAKFSVDLKTTDTKLERNVPKSNQAVASFIKRSKGKAIGNGVCWTAANEALKYAKCKRSGIYNWGRQLGPNEALLPGDIMQIEKAKFQGPHHRGLKIHHHTSIITEIEKPRIVKVLHQNFGRGGKTMSQGKFYLDELKRGSVVFFRPTTGTPGLPLNLMPYRRSSAKIVRNKLGQVDLLRTLDPELDAVRGIWEKWAGPLSCHKERMGKLQIPFDLPESYIIRGKIKRIFGKDAYVLTLVVGGQQCVLTMDGFGGETTGVGLIDGKKESQNETAKKTKIFPLNKTVDIEVTVTPTSILMKADDKTMVDWNGDASRLSMSRSWLVPNKKWLHLGVYESVFETKSLTLEMPNSD